MRTFVLHLQDAIQYERVEDVESFVGRDRSGSFGILAGHERAMTVLDFGLARYRCAGRSWQHLAMPGGVLYFAQNELYLSTRRYVHGEDPARIGAALRDVLRAQEADLRGVKDSLRRLEEEMLKRLWRRTGEPLLG